MCSTDLGTLSHNWNRLRLLAPYFPHYPSQKKIETVTKSIDQVQNVIISKREELVMVNKVLQVKQQDALAQAQQAALGKLDSLQRPSTSK